MLQIALAQINPTVGDLEANRRRILTCYQRAVEDKADLIVFPELSVCGYPPEDLILSNAFVTASMEAVNRLLEASKGQRTAMLVGAPWQEGGKTYNAALLIEDGEIVVRQYKADLPNYGVFDEKRVFAAGSLPKPVLWRGARIGILICEDMWSDAVPEALAGSDFLIGINASPFEIGKHDQRMERAGRHVERMKKPLIYVNQICGHDDLVFDGDSFVMSREGMLRLRLKRFEEDYAIATLKKLDGVWRTQDGRIELYDSWEQVVYLAMMLGLREYVDKNGFPGVVIGMSGGIDSALTAAVAVDALGAERVALVMMPSEYTSKESLRDAAECAELLGLSSAQCSVFSAQEKQNTEHRTRDTCFGHLITLPITSIYDVYEEALAPLFSGRKPDLTEENLQSRIRGMLLMAISNKFGPMVVSTGNKSEMSVGYATLYGDMCGGYSVLKDVYKTQVFALAKWRNGQASVQCSVFGVQGAQSTEHRAQSTVVIPENILTKAPTAELRHNQRDDDSLPPYETLDAILHYLVEEQYGLEQVLGLREFDEQTVRKVHRLLHSAEYKRRQSPPGVKISKRPFSRDRRVPITHKFMG